MAETEYHRLTRARARSAFGIVSISRSSLWLGNDHVLRIDTTGYTETYKRFYFRDIQAIIIRKTEAWKILGLVFSALAGLFGLIAIFGGDPIVAWIFGSMAAVFLLALILDLVAGPTCVSYLRTAVQTEELISLNRLRRARKTLERLRPSIAGAQGQLAPEEIHARMQERMGATPGVDPKPAETAQEEADDPNAPPRIVS